MLLWVLRFMRGYAAFTVSGKYPERFLNITSRHRVRLWNVARKDGRISACMCFDDYLHIRPLARGAGVSLHITQKHGFPQLVRRYRDRIGIVLGICSFILTVFIMSLFVWSIDITGLDTVSLSQMQEELHEEGLYIGAFKPGLDYRQITRDILLKNHDVGWMAINVSGSYASVEIKEEAHAPEVADIYTPCNIKAKSDGRVLRIEAAQGETVIKEGSGVIEGQLLVSGVMTGEQVDTRLVHADARVIARTKRQASFSVSATNTLLRPGGECTDRKSLLLFGACVPFRFSAVDSPYSVADDRVDSPNPLGVTLPIGIRTETVSAMKKEEMRFDENSAKEILVRESELFEMFSLTDCEVEKREYRLSCKDDIYTLNVTYTCIEDIAYEETIGVEKTEDGE